MKRTFAFGFAAVLAMALSGCGGSSGGSTPGSTTANSLSDLPATSTLVTGGAAAASLSAKTVGKAVTGTPPYLKDISSDNVDTYFWGGLLATLSTTNAEDVTESQRQAYWQGEGACRMAQAVGYSFENVLNGGISMCYMQNMPNATNGVAITSGSFTAANIFDQEVSNKLIKVVVSGEPGERAEGQDVYIKVYGTTSIEGAGGYAADLWFCSSGSANGSEQIRVNNTTNIISTTSTHSDFGSFVGTISAYLTTNASGQFVFDSTKDRSATVYFGPSGGAFTFLGAVTIDSAGLITARDWQTGTFGEQSSTNKHAVFANYTGDTMATLAFSAASFSLQDNFGGNPMSITDATEYSTTRYVNADSGTLLTTAQAETFNADVYSGLSSSQYTSAVASLSAVSSLSCTETPDAIVTMDFSQSGPQAVAALCENNFDDNGGMNFCDGPAVGAARDKIFSNQIIQGACETSFCMVGDDFSCQLWADNNIGNEQGLTTANAGCSNTGCCEAQ